MITLIILLCVILLDITVNWYLIEKLKIRPNHFINWGLRAIIGLFLAKYGPSTDNVHVILKALSYVPVYWSLFDLGLNAFRHKPFDYLGDAEIDKEEEKLLPDFPIFCFKAMIAILCILLLVFDYNPNPW